jgi:cytochrome c
MLRLLTFAVVVPLIFIAGCDIESDVPANSGKAQSADERIAAAMSTSVVLTREQALDLAARSNCLLCHKIDYKLVGPAWKDVAAKYRGVPNAVHIVASHITTGGRFGWNFGTMPPRGGGVISDGNIANMARFIVSLK